MPKPTMAELQEGALRFLEAGERYFKMARDAGIAGSVIWYDHSDRGLVLFTRGEYRGTLLRNVHDIGTPVVSFGSVAEDEEDD